MGGDGTAGDLNRRQFVMGAGLSAAALGGLAMGAPTAQAAPVTLSRRGDWDYDLVVIGGGFAGVTAARDSARNGFRTLILEARNRLGGRTFTTEFEGHRIELGGTWIHWSQPFVWAEKERYGLSVTETPGAVPDRMIMRLAGKTRDLTETELYSVVEAYGRYTADARTALPRPYDIRYQADLIGEADRISAQDRLDALELSPLQRTALESVLCSSAHNTPDTLSYVESLRWSALSGFNDFLLMIDAVGRFQLEGGTSALIDAMMEDGRPDVRLATPVKTVEELDGRVRITTSRGEQIMAGAAVVTLPMNTLPEVAFQPPLDPRLSQAASERHTGQGFKVYIKAKGRHGRIFTVAPKEHPLGTVFTYHEGDDYTLFVGFGVDASRLDYYDEQAVGEALADFLPGVEVVSVMAYDWVLDPYSRGTWCCYRPGWMERYLPTFQQDRGRILFASGDHGEGWRGFIDGAIGAGTRAAQRLRGLIG